MIFAVSAWLALLGFSCNQFAVNPCIVYPRAAAVHLNFRAGSIFPVPIGLAGATRLMRSDFRLNLLLLKGQRCVKYLYPRTHILKPLWTRSHYRLEPVYPWFMKPLSSCTQEPSILEPCYLVTFVPWNTKTPKNWNTGTSKHWNIKTL